MYIYISLPLLFHPSIYSGGINGAELCRLGGPGDLQGAGEAAAEEAEPRPAPTVHRLGQLRLSVSLHIYRGDM